MPETLAGVGNAVVNKIIVFNVDYSITKAGSYSLWYFLQRKL